MQSFIIRLACIFGFVVIVLSQEMIGANQKVPNKKPLSENEKLLLRKIFHDCGFGVTVHQVEGRFPHRVAVVPKEFSDMYKANKVGVLYFLVDFVEKGSRLDVLGAYSYVLANEGEPVFAAIFVGNYVFRNTSIDEKNLRGGISLRNVIILDLKDYIRKSRE